MVKKEEKKDTNKSKKEEGKKEVKETSNGKTSTDQSKDSPPIEHKKHKKTHSHTTGFDTWSFIETTLLYILRIVAICIILGALFSTYISTSNNVNFKIDKLEDHKV